MNSAEHNYLLLDERIVDNTQNLRLKLGRVQKSSDNPLFGEDFFSDPPRKWEARYDNLYPSVIYDDEDGIYKLWYNAFIRDQASEKTPLTERGNTAYRSGDREDGLLYTFSQDGLRWEKPNLGIIPFTGSSSNNIVMDATSHGIHGVGVLKDPDDPDRSRRFKALLLNATAKKMAVAFSEDGLHWSPPVLWPEHDDIGDAHPNAVRLPDSRGYAGIMRGSEGEGTARSRVVMKTTSSDFIHWSKPEKVLAGENLHDQIYSMPVIRYGGVYLGFPAVFHGGNPSASDWDTVDSELAWSPDTVAWHRICPGTPLIPRGPGRYPTGAYDCGCVYSAAPLLVGDTHRLYYGGSNGPHSGFREGSFCLATLPKDRFAGYGAKDTSRKGRLTTRAIVVDGSTVEVNADIARGSLRAGIVGGSGSFIQGFGLDDCVSLREGGLEVMLEWKKSVEHLHGQTVSFIFELQEATLYAFSFSGQFRRLYQS